MSAPRFARQVLVAEIGEAGQRRIGESSIRASGDARASEIANEYLVRAGARIGSGREVVIEPREVGRIAGREDLREAAAFLAGSLAAAAALLEVAGASGKPAPAAPCLTEDPE